MKKLHIFLLSLISLFPVKPYHSCPFELCPYKGEISFNGVIATGQTEIDYTQNFSDAYYIDSLHFIFPSDSYDELEEKLFN